MGIFHAVALKEVVTILIHAIHACHNTAKPKGIHGAQTPILSVSPSSFSLSPIVMNIIIINYKMFALPHLSTFLINAHMKLKHCKAIGPWSSEGINW